MQQKLVALVGLARAGKNSVAEIMSAYNFVPFAFADKVREALLALDPYIPTDAGLFIRVSELVSAVGWELAKLNPCVRSYLQKLGSEVGRDIIGARTWINLVLPKFVLEPKAVISDTRFPNEADAVREAGGVVWKVERPNFESGVSASHQSEALIKLIVADLTIINDGTLEDLKMKVAAAIETL